MLRPPWVLTSSCLVLRVCASSATVPACCSSDSNSNTRASTFSASASLLRARQLQQALLCLASSAPLCFFPCLLAAASSLTYDHASPTLLSALVDPLRLESGSSNHLNTCACATCAAACFAPSGRRGGPALPTLVLLSDPDGPAPPLPYAPDPRNCSFLLVGLTRPSPSAVMRQRMLAAHQLLPQALEDWRRQRLRECNADAAHGSCPVADRARVRSLSLKQRNELHAVTLRGDERRSRRPRYKCLAC